MNFAWINISRPTESFHCYEGILLPFVRKLNDTGINPRILGQTLLETASLRQIAELLSVLITAEPLQGLQLENTPAELSAVQVAEWENRWGKNVGRLEMADGAGQIMTDAEAEAGSGTRLLTHTDPLPQSIYYSPNAKLAEPSFINIRLQYSEP